MVIQHVPESPGAIGDGANGRVRVLAADDDLVSRQVLRRALKAWGYEPVVAADGIEARACLLAPDAPRMAVVDWDMPGLDGVDLCREVRRLRTDTAPYMLLLTGKSDSADIVRGLDAGADDYVTKPFDLDVLRARVSVGARVTGLQGALEQRFEELAAAEQRYRELVDGVGVAVWQADTATWNMGFLNRQGEVVFRRPLAACVGPFDFWSTSVIPDDREALQAFRERLALDHVAPPFEYRIMDAEGRITWLRDTVRLLCDRHGQTLVRGVTQDIAAQKEAELAREAALQMQASFVSFASHQLRTPLAGISWMLEVAAQEDGLPDTVAETIGDAREACGRLTTLVNDLLNTARLESGRLTLSPEPADLCALTRAALAGIGGLVERHGHDVSVDIPDDPVAVHVDVKYLHEALLNLMSNAVKYTPDGGTVTVSVTSDEGVARVRVRDSGIGIAPEAQAHLFEKFYRAPNAERLETEGTGLGLYLVKLIATRLGGRVMCESALGAGSTFVMELPLAAAVAARRD